MKAFKHWLIGLAIWWGFGIATTTATNLYITAESSEMIALTCMSLPVLVVILFEITLQAGALFELLRYIILWPFRLLGLVGKFKGVGISPHRLGVMATVISIGAYMLAGRIAEIFVEADLVIIYGVWGLLWGGLLYQAFRKGFVSLSDFMEN